MSGLISMTDAIVAMLGDYVSDIHDFMFDSKNNEVFYWRGDTKVCMTFDEFVKLAYDKWSTAKSVNI